MAKLTTRKRDNLPAKTFALPGKRAYPLDTAARARSALQRVSQFGTPAEKAQVKKAVKAKFPSIDVGGVKPKAKGKKKS